MAEAQFKCPETQPTPARAEQGRGNGAAPLPRGLARTRTYAAGLGGLTRRPERRKRPAVWQARARTPARGDTCANPEGGFPCAHALTARRRALLQSQSWS